MDIVVQKINKLIEEKGIIKKTFIQKTGLTKQAVYNILGGTTAISIDNLRIFAKALDMPVSYFFEDDEQPNVQSNQTTNNMEMEYLKKEIELLKAQIVDKDEIIRLLKEGVVEKFKEQVFKKPESIKQENKTPAKKNITNKITPESVKS